MLRALLTLEEFYAIMRQEVEIVSTSVGRPIRGGAHVQQVPRSTSESAVRCRAQPGNLHRNDHIRSDHFRSAASVGGLAVAELVLPGDGSSKLEPPFSVLCDCANLQFV